MTLTAEQMAALATSAVMTVADFRRYHHSGSRTSRPEPVPERQCPNCDAVHIPVNRRRLYCKPLCGDSAEAVRKARRARAPNGGHLTPEASRIITRKVQQILGGGYNARERSLPATVKQQVWQRDHDACVLCGQPGEQVDHIAGDSNNLTNLRLLCVPCHDRHTDRRLRAITDPEMIATRDAILRRIYADTPVRPCDDPEWQHTWQGRT